MIWENYQANQGEFQKILSGQIPSAKTLEKTKNKNLILAMTGNGPKTFNYWASNDATSSQVAGLMYEGLLRYDPLSGQMLPSLAKGYSVENNGRKIIIELRRGLQWSDGEILDAEDILFTWNQIIGQSYDMSGARETVLINGQFPHIYAPDSYTIVFELADIFAPFLGKLSYPIAPEHYFAKHLAGEQGQDNKRKAFLSLMGTKDDPAQFPVSGAYQLHKYSRQERIEYRANPYYFRFDRAGHRLPYLPKLTYKLISGDLEFFKFTAGEFPMLGLTGEKIPLLRRSKTKKPFKIYDLGAANTTVFIAFNLSRKGNPPEPQRTWFNDKRFRQALSLAVNRQTMIDTIYLGVASPLCLIMSENGLFFHRELHQRVCQAQPDLERARRLLSQAGFVREGDQLYDAKGHPVVIGLFTNAGSVTDTMSPRELMSTMLKEQWAKLGIKLEPKVIEFNNLVGRVSGTRDWQTIILGLTGGDLLEPHGSANVFQSNGRLHLYDLRDPGDQFTPRPWEAQIDRLITAATRYNQFEERAKYYYQMQEILWEQMPMIYLVSPQVFVAVSEDLANFTPTKLAGYQYNLDQWFFE